MPQPPEPLEPGPPSTKADLLTALSALGRALGEELKPERLLDEFCRHLRPLLPHERLTVSRLDDSGQTFTVFAEHAAAGPLLHAGHYTTDFKPEGRNLVADSAIRPAFEGERLLVTDFRNDPRFARLSPRERAVVDAGYRSAVVLPLRSSGRVIGALVACSRTIGAYGPAQLELAAEVADLIGPFVDSTARLYAERRRRQRLGALQSLPIALAESLNVQDVFTRLADAVRPILDFEVMGVGLLSGREIKILAEVNDNLGEGAHGAMRLEDFSFADRVEGGEAVVMSDAPAELDPSWPGDRMMIDEGARSTLCVPLRFGEQVGGALYFGKREPYWFDPSHEEVASAIAAQVVLAIQHQRLAEEQRRVAVVEDRARRLEEHLTTLRSELGEQYGFGRLIGRSPEFREALARAERVTPTDVTTLLTGESGTGKELVARAIHHASPRADGPFVAVNCAALPETLLESELFGHERGAFTGADRQKPGRFERARGGTLFLDEVGELSPGVQAKLLRVLQEREFERVGGTSTVRADVRVIAATNRDLARSVAEGAFRADLYYRLHVFPVHLPALRERGEDVLLLAEHFVRDLGARMGKGEVGISRDASDALLSHPWPGNIRELQNAVERALIMSDGRLITADQLGLRPRGQAGEAGAPSAVHVFSGLAAGSSLAQWERQLVLDGLRRAGGNKSRAARLLGLTRSQLYTRLKRCGPEP
ncbi:MAG: sigma 54-interacting transcriptional regulator [Candidatus Rokubacteria bacterium]|nr:sigma 54-interacting transcriptional regulator [Candidatus Rokubacteria bacterium]